ncbi:MAG: isoleucine--tRNA ligase [Clostridiales bacterium]|jgi:isoleucyl-tRNA synthetase|nr:isoleucine--tRNA ligase [Clostridiales bacterium]
MYKKVETDNDFVKREEAVMAFWRDNDIFSRTLQETEGGERFNFYDGPPTANGRPHIGHVLTRSYKDLIPRYQTMKGKHVLRKAGWDTHGLPVELEVEKALKLDGKQDIERYGVEPFIKECKASVWKYTHDWEKMSERVSYWVDMARPYVTYDDNYIESVWWSLKEIYQKGLIYRGHKIVPYCPRCGTALSSHEVAQGYKDVEEQSAVAKFRVTGEADTYLLAWTTTPWTLPGNIALCLNAGLLYSCVEAGGARYILASALVKNFFEDYTVVYEKTGRELAGLSYQPLYPIYRGGEKAYYTVTDGYVSLSEGSGIVHIAPAFGEDDARVGKTYGLPFIQPIDERGRLTEDTPFPGVFCKDADKLIFQDLSERGLLLKKLPYTHSYPFCWRCDTPLIYYARASWFIRVTEIKDRLIAANNSVNWIPESIGKGRMGNFLENVVDWGISRERYWGTPLPIWVCGDCGGTDAIGSKDELKARGGLTDGIELHKPYVDAVTIRCPHCGGVMRRTPEVVDCWYDSGAMPFAQWHYPFENKERFSADFPADFISEAVDQTRGWFYTLLVVSTILFDRSPFKSCIVLGHVGDKNGIKMSKHKGNVIDPWVMFDRYGADAVRWYFYAGSNPWLPSRFYEDAVAEVVRKFMLTLWNTYSFYILYADIDGFDPTKYALKACKPTKMDQWALSKTQTLIKSVDEDLAAYRVTEAARAIAAFVDELSNWYVRRCRERYWDKGMGADKTAAFMTLYTVLENLIRLLAPFTPMLSESIYQNLVKSVDKQAPISVHLTAFPAFDKSLVDKKLEAEMATVLSAVIAGRAARNKSGVKNRQPLARMLLGGAGAERLGADMLSIIADELNVKGIERIADAEGYISYSVKPQLKTLGPKYGKKLNAIREYLSAHADEAVEGVKKGSFSPPFDPEIVLTKEDLLIEVVSRAGFAVESENGVTAILDTAVTPELLEEGLYRELVSKVQSMRKEADFAVTDHISLGVWGDGAVLSALNAYRDEVKKDVLADRIETDRPVSGREWELNGRLVTIAVRKV